MDHVANGPGIQQLSEAYVPYLLEFEDETDGVALSAALVVLRREDGYLLAVPSQFFTEDVLEQAQTPGPDDMLGQSVVRRAFDDIAGFILLDICWKTLVKNRPFWLASSC